MLGSTSHNDGEAAAIRATANSLRRNRGMKEDEVAWDKSEKSVGEVLLGTKGPKETYDWEFPYYLLMGGGFALAIAGEWMRSDRRVLSWARDEAEERRRRRADGLEVETGYNYAPGGPIVNTAEAHWIKTIGSTRSKKKTDEEE
jgi:hypothetical protein